MFRNPTMKVVVFIDFDGTLTRRDGGKTVSDPFYKSLYQKPDLIFDSPQAKMKDEKTLIGILKNTFGEDKPDYTKQNSDLLITEDAVAFLHTMLANPEIKVNIISKNRQEYIIALLKYHGFNPEEIARLTIKPLTVTSKSEKVYDTCTEQSLGDIKPIAYLFDDTREELAQMLQPIQYSASAQFPIDNVYYHLPGAFPWKEYAGKIERHTKKSSVEEKKDEQPADKLAVEIPSKEKTNLMQDLTLFPPKKPSTDDTMSPTTSARQQPKLKSSE